MAIIRHIEILSVRNWNKTQYFPTILLAVTLYNRYTRFENLFFHLLFPSLGGRANPLHPSSKGRENPLNCRIRVSFHAIPTSITESRLRQKRAGISTFPSKQGGFKFQFSSYTPIFAKFRRELRNSHVFSCNFDEYYGIAFTSKTRRNFNFSEKTRWL